MSTGELIAMAIAAGVALFITAAGMYISAHGFGEEGWEYFWKRQVKQKAEEKANRRRFDDDIEQAIEKFKQSRKRHRLFTHYIIGGGYGFLIVYSIFYLIIRLATNSYERYDGSVGNTAITEIPVLVCFGIIAFVFVHTLSWYSLKRFFFRKNRNIRNPITARGVVVEAKTISTSTTQVEVSGNINRRGGNMGRAREVTWRKIHVWVFDIDRPVSCMVGVGKTTKKWHDVGTRVKVTFDERRPKRGRIEEEPAKPKSSKRSGATQETATSTEVFGNQGW